MTQRSIAAALVGLALAGLALWLLFVGHDGGVIGYVASANKKVYAVDLMKGVVLRESATIEHMGRPSAIEYVGRNSMLFVASERGRRQNDYYPLVAIESHSLEVARTYTLDSSGVELLRSDTLNPSRLPVYNVVASPDGHTLYLGSPGPDGQLTAVFNPVSGTVVAWTDIPIRQHDYLSPDGQWVAEVWPAGNRVLTQEGDQRPSEWSGGVAVIEISTGNVVSRTELTANKGLHPSWNIAPGPYLYLKPGSTELTIYDRESGEKISVIDLQSLTGMTPAQTAPVAIPDSSLVAIAMVSPEGRGFVAVIDTASQEIKSTIEVGPSPTNVVLVSHGL